MFIIKYQEEKFEVYCYLTHENYSYFICFQADTYGLNLQILSIYMHL